MNQLSADIQAKIKEWTTDSYFDENTQNEIKELLENEQWDELTDRFYRELEFGTGGLRGIIGAGSNRMNPYIVRRATQGLASYILSQNAQTPCVAIGFDSRLYSDTFAEEAACVFAANGIRCHLYKTLRPVPLLSFAVRETNSIAGISVTASHNPKEYNGYKVYWNDGAQVTPPHDRSIIDQVNSIKSLRDVKTISLQDAISKDLIQYMDQDMDNAYFEAVKHLKVHQDFDTNYKLVYTPIHGSGNKPVQEILKRWGFTNISIVKEQEQPDPQFSTVDYPNPEDHKALDLAVKQAQKEDADMVMGTDPDCDRLAIALNNGKEFIYLNGNQVGSLLANYIITGLKNQNKMPANPLLVKTIVTSDLGMVIAKDHGVDVLDTLTGFKYIGEQIRILQDETKQKDFLLGYEESYGYLIGTHARDKDAVISAALVAEMGAYYKAQGSSILAELDKIYEKYGYYLEDLRTVTHKGKEGAEKIAQVMANLRKSPLTKVSDFSLTQMKDYQASQAYSCSAAGEISPSEEITLPKSNVIQLYYGDHLKITARPSGTEPKIKFYYQCQAESLTNSQELIKIADQTFSQYVDQLG